MFTLWRAWPCKLSLLAAVVVLSACGEPTPEDLNHTIDTGNAGQALGQINELLVNAPTDPALNLLAAKARLTHCINLNCALSQPAELKAAAKNLTYAAPLADGLTLTDGSTLSTASIFAALAPRYAALAGQPSPTLALLELAPPAAKSAVADGLFGGVLALLRQNNTPAAVAQLQALAALPALPETLTTWAAWQAAQLNKQMGQAEGYGIALRSKQTNHLPANALRLIPHVVAETGPGAQPLERLNALPALINTWDLPTLLDAAAQTHIAAELNTLRANGSWQARVLGPGLAAITTLSGTTITAGAPLALHLNLARLSLVMAPNQPQLWNAYLPAALTYLQQDPTAPLLDDLRPSGLTADVQTRYLTALFTTIEQRVKHDQPILGLLKQAGALKLDKPTQTKLEKLLRTGLDNALNQKNIPAILAYARFKPAVARTNAAAIAPVLVRELETLLHAHKFTEADNLAALLRDDLALDFNFQALLAKYIGKLGQSPAVVALLSATSPTVLLQSQTAAQAPVLAALGPAWPYVYERLRATPAVLDAELTKLIEQAPGIYGPATAVYRFGFLFQTWPAAAQQEYLAARLQQALLQDDTLTPANMVARLSALQAVHPYLVLAPVLSHVLKQAETIADGQALWAAASPAVQADIRRLKPSFALLMAGATDLAAGRTAQAVRALGDVQTAPYAAQAAQLLAPYRQQLATVVGLYAATDATSGSPIAYLQVASPWLQGKGPADELQLTFINRLGTLSLPNPTTLGTDYAALRPASLTTRWQPETNRLNLTPSQLDAIDGSPLFTTVYGAISTITFSPAARGQPATVSVQAQGGMPLHLERVLAAPDLASLITQLAVGRFSMLVPASKLPSPPSDTLVRAMLPAGSLLEINLPSSNTPLPPEALMGRLWHPATRAPIMLNGNYNAGLFTSTFAYTYPLPSGGGVKAELTCQVLAGPVLCAAHNLHQPRERNILVMRGAQTIESLRTTKATRMALNNAAMERLQAAPLTPAAPDVPAASSATSTSLLPPPANIGASTTSASTP